MDQTPARSVYYTASESGDPETPYPYQTPRANWGSSAAGTTPRAQGRINAFDSHLQELPSDGATIVITPRVAHWALPFPQPRGQPASENSTITARRYVSSPISTNTATPTRSRTGFPQATALSATPQHAPLRSVSSSALLDGPSLIQEVMLRDCAIGDTGYSAKLYTAVDRVASSLAARGRTKESNAMRALYDQSFKDPGSADLLDAIIRRRTSERQKLDFRRYAEDVIRVGLLDEAGQPGHNIVEVTAVRKRKRISMPAQEPVVIAVPRDVETGSMSLTDTPAHASGDSDKVDETMSLEEELPNDNELAIEDMPLANPSEDPANDNEPAMEDFPLEDLSEEVPISAEVASIPPMATEQELRQERQDLARATLKRASRRHRRGKKRRPKELGSSAASIPPLGEVKKPLVVQRKRSQKVVKSQLPARVLQNALVLEIPNEEHIQRLGRRKSKHQYRMFHGANGPVYSINLLEGSGSKKHHAQTIARGAK